jgi:hypothetical protein
VKRVAVGEGHLDHVAGAQQAEIVEDPGRLKGVDVAHDDGRPDLARRRPAYGWLQHGYAGTLGRRTGAGARRGTAGYGR